MEDTTLKVIASLAIAFCIMVVLYTFCAGIPSECRNFFIRMSRCFRFVYSRKRLTESNRTIGDKGPVCVLPGGFVRGGLSGMRASESFNRLAEAMNHIGPAANAAGVSLGETAAVLNTLRVGEVSQGNLGDMIHALTYANSNINVTTASVTLPPVLEPPSTPVCKPPKEDLSTCTGEGKPEIRMIHFKKGG